MSDSRCRLVLIARGEVASVQHCPHCGCVSVNLGPTTVRLDPQALRSLWSTVAEAIGALTTETDSATATTWTSARGKA